MQYFNASAIVVSAYCIQAHACTCKYVHTYIHTYIYSMQLVQYILELHTKIAFAYMYYTYWSHTEVTAAYRILYMEKKNTKKQNAY